VRELGERGDQPSLVVIHGGPDVGHGYLVPGFADVDRHVVLFDFRGCGRSTRGLPADRLQPEYVVEDTRRLIAELELGQVDLLGFSTGGRAAIQFVDKHPELVRRLVLASTSAYDGTAAEPYLAGWAEYQRREAAAKPEERNSTIFVWDLAKAPAYLDLLNSLGDEGDWSYERAVAGLQHPWFAGDPEQILRDFARPILILHGAKDMGFPLQLAERLHTAVPNSRLAVVPDAAHMCHFERPELWGRHLREFLEYVLPGDRWYRTEAITMEFLVEMTTVVPAGTSEAEVDAMREREAARAGELIADGNLLRLWRPPLRPGEWRTFGLFAAADAESLEKALASMPLRAWRTDKVTPLGAHPNDPVPPTPHNPDAQQFFTTFTLTIPDDVDAATVEATYAAEGRTAAAQAAAGHLVRLWRLPSSQGFGLWQTTDAAALDDILNSLPLKPWMQIETVPLSRHPSDPA